MHLTPTALALATVAVYVTPAVALAIGPSRTALLGPRDWTQSDSEYTLCYWTCSGTCTHDSTSKKWQCNHDADSVPPDQGPSKLTPRDANSTSISTGTDPEGSASAYNLIMYPNMDSCVQSCTGLCSGSSSGELTASCDPHTSVDLSKYPDSQPYVSPAPKATPYGDESTCAQKCTGYCTGTLGETDWFCDPHPPVDPSKSPNADAANSGKASDANPGGGGKPKLRLMLRDDGSNSGGWIPYANMTECARLCNGPFCQDGNNGTAWCEPQSYLDSQDIHKNTGSSGGLYTSNSGGGTPKPRLMPRNNNLN